MSKTKIEWCDLTVNPVVGCSKCSPGCDNCYAERFAVRMVRHPNRKISGKYRGVVDERGRWTGKIGLALDGCFEDLYSVKRAKRVFIGSMGDLFHENVPQSEVLKLINAMSLMPQHTFLLLTKRPERARDVLDGILGVEGFGYVWLGVTVCNQDEASAKIPVLLGTPAAKRFVSVEPMLGPVDIGKYLYGSYECGLSCGTRLPCTETPEKQCTKCGFTGPDDYATWGDGDCAECPKCGQSGCCGEIEEICPDCGTYMVREHPDTPNLDWVICGGETGPGARPMHPDWARSLRDQCKASCQSTPFFFKGWGEFSQGAMNSVSSSTNCNTAWPDGTIGDGEETVKGGRGTSLYRFGKRRAGRLLDGVEYNEVPHA